MKRLKHISRQFWRDERGITSIEYALIASIVSICAVGAMTVIGTKVNRNFNGILPGLN